MLVLSSCATPYQREGYSGGYTDNAIGSNRYLVHFSGNGYTAYSTVQSYAIQRAKEVCTENGFADFDVLNANGQTTAYSNGNYQTNCYGNQCTTRGPSTVDKHTMDVTVQCKNPVH
jgi:hypothetical protein